MSEPLRAFEDVPRDARGHLCLLFHAAVFHLLFYLRCRADALDRPLEEILQEHPFLVPYFGQIRTRLPEEIDWEDSLKWLRE